MNKAQKKIVQEAKKRNLETAETNQEESFRKSRLEVRKVIKEEQKAKKV